MKRRLLASAATLWVACMFFLPICASRVSGSGQSKGVSGQGQIVAPSPLAWTAPVQVGGTPFDARAPMLVVDRRSGSLHLTWEEDGRVVRYARRDAQTWQVDPRAWSGHSPAIALDADGFPHIAYVNTVGSPGIAQIYHLSSRSGWIPSPVSDSTGSSQTPDIGLAADGHLDVVWAEMSLGTTSIYRARSRDLGVTWLEMEPIGYGSSPRLAHGPMGGVHVAWQAEKILGHEENLDVYVSDWGIGGWGPAANVSQSAGDALGVGLASDSQGRLSMVWEQEAPDGLSAAIRFASRVDGVWSVPVTLSLRAGFVTQPSVAVGPDNVCRVAWDGGFQIELLTATKGGSWGSIETIATEDKGIRDVSLAVDAYERTSAAWCQRTPLGQWAVFYSAKELAPTITPTTVATPTASATATPVDTSTPTPTSTARPSSTLTATATITPTMTPTLSVTPTRTAPPTIPLPTATPEATPSSTATSEPTATPTATETEPWPPTRWFIPAVMVPVWPDPLPTLTPTPSLVLSRALGASPSRSTGPRSVPAWQWSDPTKLSWRPPGPFYGGDSRSGDLVTAGDGKVIAVWEEPYLGWDFLHVSVLSKSGWSDPSPLFGGEEPDLVLAGDGTVYLVYASGQGGQYDISCAKWTGRGWDLLPPVSATSGTSTQPAIAAKSDGTLLVVWTDTTEGETRIYNAWMTAAMTNTVWNTYFIAGTSYGSAPEIAVGPGDRVWVVWQQRELYTSGDYDIYAVYGDGMSSWHDLVVNISDTPGSPGTGEMDSTLPRIVSAPRAGSFVVWQENDGDLADVYYTDNLADVQRYFFGVPVNLSDSLARSRAPAVDVGDRGQASVAWDEGDRLLFRTRLDPSAPWSPTAVLALDKAGSVREAAVLTESPARVHALWSQSTAETPDDYDIYVRTGSLSQPYRVSLPVVVDP